MLRQGTHINAVGAFQPHTRELDDTAIQRARIAVETFDGAEAEAGDLIIPTKAGRVTRAHWLADLHQVVSNKVQVHTSPTEITLFKSVGCALEDLAIAELLDAAQSTPQAGTQSQSATNSRPPANRKSIASREQESAARRCTQ